MRILVVDDREEDRILAETLLQTGGEETRTAINGADALQKLRAEHFDVIVSDILMPVMDGFRLCQECKTDEALRHIPFVFLTSSYTEDADETLAFRLGADGFIRKPVEPECLTQSIRKLAGTARESLAGPAPRPATEDTETLKMYSARLVAKLEQKVCEVEEESARREKVREELRKANVELQRALKGTIEVIQQMVEARDPYTSGHQRRVAELVVAIAREMRLPEDSCVSVIQMAALIHDIGKTAVPSDILSKPGKLTAAEMMLVKSHPQVGYDILSRAQLPDPVAEVVLQHHERLDGSGYPRGLTDDAILPEAQILAAADVVEAMSSHRPYRQALGIVAALDEVSAGRGIRYDADVVDACFTVFHEGHFAFSDAPGFASTHAAIPTGAEPRPPS